MNHLPQNELLSAYLDGELTAGEQADVERLLAANPAARQMLDELRSLSTVLQSLPQQKLGEDLSAEVLRIAERRMLTEGKSEAAAPSPATHEPVSRMISRRFLNRRSMGWLAVVAAIAVMISINDRQQQKRPADKGREVARTPVVARDAERSEKLERSMKKPGEMPEIRALPVVAEKPADKSRVMSPAKREAKEYVDKKPLSKVMADRLVENEKVATPPGGEGEANFGGMGGGSPMRATEETASAEKGARSPLHEVIDEPRSPPAPARMSKAAGMSRKGGVYESIASPKHGSQFGQSAAGVLVVFCDISPDAAKKKSFDKLLDANGITWHRESVRTSGELRNLAVRDPSRSDAKQAVAGGQGQPQEQQVAAEGTLRQLTTAGNAELVYAEATPAQVKAALAGLEAQPNVFLSVSVRPARDELSRQYVERVQKERRGAEKKSAGDGRGDDWRDRETSKDATGALGSPAACAPPAAKKSDTAASKTAPANQAPSASVDRAPGAPPSSGRSPTQAGETQMDNFAVPQAAPGQSPSDAKQEAALEPQRFGSQPEAMEFHAQSAPRQRVLFVLRVGGETPTAAAARAAVKADADASKSPSSTPPPASKPAPSK